MTNHIKVLKKSPLKKRYLFYISHPAIFHLFKNPIRILKEQGHRILVLIKSKEVLEDLTKHAHWPYINIFPGERAANKAALLTALIIRNYKIFKIALKFRPNVMIGTAPEVAQVGRVLQIPSIIVNDDDIGAVPYFTALTYPFADCVVTPHSCAVRGWQYKTVKYPGYHALAYLHPDYFMPEPSVIERMNLAGRRYFILRLVKLSAHHDTGKNGINDEEVAKIINTLKPFGEVFISAEREIPAELAGYKLVIDPDELHSLLYYADLLITDGQSMAAEAAILGTPSIRFNDFVGKIGYLDELENAYHLTSGIKSSSPNLLLNTIHRMVIHKNLKEEYAVRKSRMLKEKIDVTCFLSWIIGNYPASVRRIRETPALLKDFYSCTS